MPLPITVLKPNHSDYPPTPGRAGTADPRPSLWAIGDSTLLHRRYLGLFASVKCPGDAILRAYDLARELRDAGIPVIGGFHSPMEKECLDLLLRGRQPVVMVPARGIEGMRIPGAWRPAIDDGRLLILSPFDPAQRRVTATLAERRNAAVAAISEALLVIHSAPGSSTERLALAAVTAGKPVFLAIAASNPLLADAGATASDIAWIRAATASG
jgi:predicted Rossmann fold nucleotide-binding protein DprA/Smf involved in DNA uptake